MLVMNHSFLCQTILLTQLNMQLLKCGFSRVIGLPQLLLFFFYNIMGSQYIYTRKGCILLLLLAYLCL